MDVENMSVRLTADADGFNATIDSAKNSLSAFAIEERSLQAQQATLNRAIAANADKVELLGSKCNTLLQKIAAQNQKIQQATAKYGENSAQVIRLREGLVRLENQYNSQNTKLEKAQAQSGKLAEQLKNVQAREQELSETVKRTNNSLDEQQKEFVQTAQKGDSLGNQLKSTFLMLKGLAVGYAGKTLFNALIGSNAEYEQSMTSFEVLLQSADKANELMNDITKFAAKTPFGMEDLQQSAKMLLGYGVQAENVMDIMGRLGDLSQGNAEKLDRVSLAYGQMLAKGKVTGEELRQMIEAQVPLLQGLVDYLGKSSAEVQKMISDGEVSIDDLNGAIKQMTSEGGQFFGMLEKQSSNMKGMWATLTDNVSIFAREVGDEAFNVLKDELTELVSALEQMSDSGELSDMAKEWGQNIAQFVRIVTGAIEIIYKMRSVIIGAGAAWVTWKTLNTVVPIINSTVSAIRLLSTVIQLGATKQQFQNLVDGKTVLLKNNVTGAITIETAAKAKEMIATDGATVSQLKFNAALLANPYTLVAVALGVLVTGLMTYNQHLDSVKQAEEQARSEAIQTASEYREQSKSIDDLTKKYKELASQTNLDESAKQELKSIQEQLNSLFGDESDKLDLVNGKYDEQIEKIRTLSQEKAAQKATELFADYSNSRKGLMEYGYKDLGTMVPNAPRLFDGIDGIVNNQMITGTLSERLKIYDSIISKAQSLNDLTDKENNILQKINDERKDTKKAYDEEMQIASQYIDLMVQSGQWTEEQAEKEKAAIAGSIEKWNELTSAQNENAVSAATVGDTAVSAAEDQSDALEKIKGNLRAVQTALDELKENKKINISTMEELIKTYPELIECLDDEKALQDALIQKENEEKSNYLSVLQEKYVNTVLFGDNVSAENKRLIDNLAEAYGVDAKNFKSIAEVKQKIDNLLIETMGENWSSFYSSQAEALEAFISFHRVFGGVGPVLPGQDANASNEEIEAKLAQAEAAVSLIKKVTSITNSYTPKTVDLSTGSSKGSSGSKKDSETANKKAEEAAKRAEEERIKGLFANEDRWRQMGWISEQQYYENITALRDQYYEKWSDDWWSWTLKIDSYNKSQHKQYVDDLEKNFDEYLSASADYISKRENDGWGTDSEIDAYKRRAERIKQYQAELIENEQLTADERNELWLKADEELYQNGQKLKQALRADLETKNQESLSYIEERTYFNDWQNVGDSPEDAFNRIKERNLAALQAERITEEEYNKNISEAGKKLYEGRLADSQAWLEHEKKYSNMSTEDYIAGLERVKQYTDEYLQLGMLSYRDYAEYIQDINDKIFDSNTDLIDEMLKSGSEAYEELRKAFSDMENQMQDTWSHDDRIKDINRTFAEMEEFKGAVTSTGQEHYEQLREELLSLQREEELYNLQQDNNKILNDMEASIKQLETLKSEKLSELVQNTDKIQAVINELVEKGKTISREQTEKSQKITAQYTTNNSIVQNNNVTDNVAASTLIGSLIGIFK